MNHIDIEIRAWPPGAYSSKAVLAVHTPSGAAVVVNCETNRERNQKLAVERLGLVVANLPWSSR
jgi:hypothetical protein